MSNGEVCCILGVCCPAGSTAQREHLIELIHKQRPAFTHQQAVDAADRVLVACDNFAGVKLAIDAA